MKQALFLSIILAPLAILAQAPAPFPVTIDSQRGTAPALSVFQANQVTFRVSYKSGGTANSIDTETPFMYWQPFGATNVTVVTGNYSIVSASSGIVDFAFSPQDLNFTPGVYTYQAGLGQSGGPMVIKQGAFTILASAASVGAEPIIFATTNVNWGNINWIGLPDYDLVTNVNAKITSLSNSLQSAINNIDGSISWSQNPATQDVNFAQYYATNIGGIDFDTTPSGSPQPARIQWNADRSTLDLGINENINLDVGQQLMLFAKSIETNTINKGEVVFVAGASGDNPTIKRASNESEPLSARTIGIAAETIASNNNGIVVTAGTVYNINTTNFTQGANLYLGANGTLQTNLPTAPLHGVFIGVVERVGENNGQIFVHVQNYQEIEELSDVNVKGRQTNDLLLWNGTVWTNYASTNIVATEIDPIWSSASNLYYLASNPSNFLTSYTETDPVWSSASNLYATTASVAAAYLSIDGGLMNGNISMGGNNIDMQNGYIEYLSWIGFDDGIHFITNTATFIGTNWSFESQPDIPGYLTSTGAAATYVQITNLPAQIVTTNNLDTIAGSGLAVTNNQLIATGGGGGYVNVITPVLASTNVSGTWTIDLKTNASVAIYEQIGNVTQVVFSVDDTNQIALAEILLLATTNSITWPTNGLTWAAGSEPTPTASEYNRIYFEAWRDYVYAVFVGSNP